MNPIIDGIGGGTRDRAPLRPGRSTHDGDPNVPCRGWRHPFVLYREFGERIQAEAGFPFAGTLVPTERVHQIVLPGGRAVRAVHVGPYDRIGAAWERVNAWLGEHELIGNGPPWEGYLTGPDEPGPPVTEILFPIC